MLQLESIIYTRTFRTWMGEDGIARTFVLDNAEVKIEDARENSIAVNSLYKGQKFPLLVNITAIHSITREARSHFSVKDRETNITAFAIVVKSELGKIIANFFFRLNKVGVPARMFTDEFQALEWLRKYKPVKTESS